MANQLSLCSISFLTVLVYFAFFNCAIFSDAFTHAIFCFIYLFIFYQSKANCIPLATVIGSRLWAHDNQHIVPAGEVLQKLACDSIQDIKKGRFAWCSLEKSFLPLRREPQEETPSLLLDVPVRGLTQNRCSHFAPIREGSLRKSSIEEGIAEHISQKVSKRLA